MLPGHVMCKTSEETIKQYHQKCVPGSADHKAFQNFQNCVDDNSR